MKAHEPPAFWASAMMWSGASSCRDDSGPKISTMRPRGTPPTPSAMSSASPPVEMASIGRGRLVAQAHDRALAELLLDLPERCGEGLVLLSLTVLLLAARSAPSMLSDRRPAQPPGGSDATGGGLGSVGSSPGRTHLAAGRFDASEARTRRPSPDAPDRHVWRPRPPLVARQAGCHEPLLQASLGCRGAGAAERLDRTTSRSRRPRTPSQANA